MPPQRRVFLVPHDPAWATVARAHMEPVSRILGAALLEWHHIGSTAIPGIHAKPIIAGDPEVERHLAFREFLRAMPERAGEYGAVKLACAAQHPTDIFGYMACKDALCKQIEADALIWTRSRRED